MKKQITIFCLFFFCSFAYAEGTKQLDPTSTDQTLLLINSDGFGNFAAYNAPDANRLYFTIHSSTEEVYIGLSQERDRDGNAINSSYYYQIKNSAGAIVKGPIQIGNGTWNINSYNEAVAGPADIVGSSGYPTSTDFKFSDVPGDYYIEFSNLQTSNSDRLYIHWFDITVAEGTTIKNGRVWSKNWAFRTPQVAGSSSTDYNGQTYTFDNSWDRPFNASLYVYSDNNSDGELKGFTDVIEFGGSGFRGLSFNISFNATGVSDTGDLLEDRKSVENINSTYSEYLIFLNNPDPDIWLDDEVGQVFIDDTIVTCVDFPNDSDIELFVNKLGQVELILDFNDNGVYDANTRDVIFAQEVVDNDSDPNNLIPVVFTWNNEDGLGTEVSGGNQIPLIATLQQGVYHLPVYDVEYNIIGYSIRDVRPARSNYAGVLFYDDTKIINGNAAGTDPTGLGEPSFNFDGCVAPCHNWLNFNEMDGNIEGYGNLNTINTWWIANEDEQSLLVTQVCTVPVDWLYFEGEKTVADQILLTWGTSQESNASHYIVQRRSDSSDEFMDIGTINASGTTQNRSDYQFLDDSIDETVAIYYYRLKQVDNDGIYAYSTIIGISMIVEENGLTVYPTIVNDNIIHIEYPVINSNSSILITIDDIKGQTVLTKELGVRDRGIYNTTVQLPYGNLAKGVYFISVIAGDSRQTSKIIIN